jgi:flagella basal body P-ring formation protein FlgA
MSTRAAALVLAMVVGHPRAGAFARPPPDSTQIVPAAQIASLAERVARSLVADPERALAPSLQIMDQRVPAGTLALAAGTPQVNPTYVSVPIAIEIDGKLARTVFAGFRVTTYVRMPVAAHDLAAGDVLGPDDLSYARLPFNGRPGLDIATFVGRKVRAVIARGEVVYPELTAVNEIVRAGMPALLIVHDGPVRLAADVVARTSGGLGDSVTIFNPQTGRALSGVVTGPNTVELTLPGATE